MQDVKMHDVKIITDETSKTHSWSAIFMSCIFGQPSCRSIINRGPVLSGIPQRATWRHDKTLRYLQTSLLQHQRFTKQLPQYTSNGTPKTPWLKKTTIFNIQRSQLAAMSPLNDCTVGFSVSAAVSTTLKLSTSPVM